jgi:hypothetical protein
MEPLIQIFVFTAIWLFLGFVGVSFLNLKKWHIPFIMGYGVVVY